MLITVVLLGILVLFLGSVVIVMDMRVADRENRLRKVSESVHFSKLSDESKRDLKKIVRY